MSRRDEVAKAAIAVIAISGVRALTHRAVDARAGVPQGTTSNHFRSRDALLGAVAEELELRDLAIWADREPPGTVPGVAAALADYAVLMTTTNAELTRARLGLMVECPDRLVPGHHRLLDALAGLFAALDVVEPARASAAVLDYLDGVILHHVHLREQPVSATQVAGTIERILGADATGR